jgi:thiopurine S-methyltransferase
LEKVNPVLTDHIDRLVSGSNKKILVPLCGETHDLFYLLGQGHSVFGIEGVRQCILNLDARDGFDLTFNPTESLYHTKDFRLQIYCGDLLSCPIEKWGPFDAVWDRGSLIALEYPLRVGYMEIMKKSLQNSNGKCKLKISKTEWMSLLYPFYFRKYCSLGICKKK